MNEVIHTVRALGAVYSAALFDAETTPLPNEMEAKVAAIRRIGDLRTARAVMVAAWARIISGEVVEELLDELDRGGSFAKANHVETICVGEFGKALADNIRVELTKGTDMEQDTDYAQVEVSAGDTIEDVARRLAASAPASTIYDGVELRVELGQDPADVIRRYVRFRQSSDIRKRLDQFAVSTVEVVAVKSPGPGGRIDPHREIKDPQAGQLYVLWERRPDHSVGNVAIVVPELSGRFPGDEPSIVLRLQHGPVVAALGSLIVELSYRAAATEARIVAVEMRLDAMARS